MNRELKPFVSGSSLSRKGNYYILSVRCSEEEMEKIKRLIASAPEMYRYLKDITSNEDIFEPTKINIDTLLARIDGEECHDKTNLDS